MRHVRVTVSRRATVRWEATRSPDAAAPHPAWTSSAITGCHNGDTSEETIRSPDRHDSTAPAHANGHDDPAGRLAYGGPSFFGYPSVVAHLLIRLKMVASMTSWSFAAAMPAFVPAR